MGADIGLGLSSMAVCFDFRSTYVVQLSNRTPYFYQFRCHNPLITQLSFADCKWKKYLLRLSYLYVRDFSFETWSIIKVWRFDCHHFLVCPPVKWKQVWHFFLLSRDYSVQCLFDLRLFSVEIKKETDGNCNMHASVCFLVSSCYYTINMQFFTEIFTLLTLI